ncbi:GNAT family N-acetyltransferase [Gordonia humi]|uniref:GNAT superfamily N-acetyltransferase n=1 Tax=Gordonia humi TaxID=686429 RepID=A0A840EX16_9ACTN|nr:GNAT family N-acetyltransferase [Gordonia humi]MBB4136131.1 GNAT superfamily N-acetyltransferase [Gordonia humi]
MKIRHAGEADLTRIRAVEVAAGAPFADLGMDLVAGDEPISRERLSEFVVAGHAWVVADDRDRAVAYLLVESVDGLAHVEQVSVCPDHAGHGLGADLIENVAAWARRHGYPAMTLTTYVDVPWNGPYYERLGFRYLPVSEETAGLRTIRAAERDHGLDRWPRACMRREL